MAETTFYGTAYVKGKASGRLMASDLELSFWGGVNPWSGEIIDRHHALCGQHLQNTILAIPGGRGSCSGSGVMLELLLNDNGPKAVIFERREDILTLGVIVAEEIFGRSIPVVTLSQQDFKRLLLISERNIHVLDGCISTVEMLGVSGHPQTASVNLTTVMRSVDEIELSNLDQSLLEGGYGEAAQVSMRIVLRMAQLLGARQLMDVTQAHVDSCIYTGPASLAFAERLRDWGGSVRVPTTLNSISIEQNRGGAQGNEPSFGKAASQLAEAYIAMGARPTFTCAPYQLESAPKLGDQIAWAESNAVVYANSVLGARTMKYPDLLDISIALTGRAPKGGPHVDINRLASLIVTVRNAPNAKIVDDSFYPLLGYRIGTLAANRIPVVIGIESLAPTKDDLKAFGAAFATVSSAPMFHILGITPEAPDLQAAIGTAQSAQPIDLELSELYKCWDVLNSSSNDRKIDLVSLGNPHFSLAEVRKLAELCQGRAKNDDVAVIVTCGRATYGLASQAGLVETLETFGIQFMTDICWCMMKEPIIPRSVAAIMTNSAKYAHYGPGLTGRVFYFGSLAACVEAACNGDDFTITRPQWLRDVAV